MIWEIKKISEITFIFNKYKDTCDNLIDSSDINPLDWADFLD